MFATSCGEKKFIFKVTKSFNKSQANVHRNMQEHCDTMVVGTLSNSREFHGKMCVCVCVW